MATRDGHAERSLEVLFHADGIHGVSGEELDCGRVMAIARAFGDSLNEGDGRFVVGHDARISSASLAEAVSLGLRSGGHHVTHIGLCTTPMVGWVGAEGGYDGSVMITGGHRPPEYNGLKLCGRDALPLTARDGLPQVRSRVRLPFAFDRSCTPVIEHRRPLDDYSCVVRRFLRGAGPLKLAIDAGNGVGGIDTRRVFDHFPHLWRHEIDFEPDGRFPHRSPDPFASGALERLSECVVKHGCAFGLAFDGDADRAAVVDERGQPVAPGVIGALVALRLLGRKPGATVLYDPGCGPAVADAIEGGGGSALACGSDRSSIQAAMRERKALFALDASGRCYYSDLHGTDNALRTLVELVQVLSGAAQTLSELAGIIDQGSAA